MMNIHFVMYMLSVVTIGFSAGNVFAFLFWHLQVIFYLIKNMCTTYFLIYKILDALKSFYKKKKLTRF